MQPDDTTPARETSTAPADAAQAIAAEPAVLRATIHVKRAATGQVETYELTGATTQTHTQEA